MKHSTLYALWGGLFIFCAGLGFVPASGSLLRACLTGLSLLFFLPPALLLWQARRDRDADTLKLLRNLSAAALSAALVLLIANVLSLAAPEALGDLLYVVFVIATAPMVCSGYWLLPLFLWACLLIASANALKKTG